MKKNICKTIILCGTIMLNSLLVYGESGMFAIGPKVGTGGIGAEARVKLMDNMFARVGGSYFKYTFPNIKEKIEGQEVSISRSFELLVVPVMIDFHPSATSGFRISAGVGYNGTNVKATFLPTRPIIIGRRTYSVEEIGKVTADLRYNNKLAGFLTLGYDNSLINDSASPISYGVEGGIMYSGELKLKVNAQSVFENRPEFNQLVKKATDTMNEGLEQIKKYTKFYPIISFSVKYSF